MKDKSKEKILKIPCFLNDEIYVIPDSYYMDLHLFEKDTSTIIKKYVVYSILIKNRNICFNCQCDENTNMFEFHEIKISNYGEKWFLTKEEALAKVEELKEKYNKLCSESIMDYWLYIKNENPYRYEVTKEDLKIRDMREIKNKKPRKFLFFKRGKR